MLTPRLDQVQEHLVSILIGVAFDRVAEDCKVGRTGGCLQSVAVIGVVGSTAFDQHILAIAIDLAVVVTLRRAATIGVGDRGIPRSLPRECLGTEAVPIPPFHPSASSSIRSP